MAVTETYTAADIQLLQGLEPVRRRPGMYVGNTDDGSGMHHMLYEVLGNAVDEHLRGFVHTIRVTIDGDRITVEDDGRGIPIDALHRVLTQLHSGPAPQPHVHLADAFRGAGVAVVNALSTELEVTVFRDGYEHVQQYARGEPITPIERLGPFERTGTRITFTPDFAILKRHEWDIPMIEERCRELTGLLPSLGIEVNGKMFRYASLVDYVRELAACDLIEPFHVCTKHDDVGIELVLAWARRGNVRCFVNCAPCGGGVQVTAMQAALTTVLGSRIPVRSERLKRRIFALVHVSLRHPKWGNPTHEWLTNTEVGDAVRDVVERELARHFDENPALLDQMLIDLQRRTRPGRSAPSPKRSARKRSRTPRERWKRCAMTSFSIFAAT